MFHNVLSDHPVNLVPNPTPSAVIRMLQAVSPVVHFTSGQGLSGSGPGLEQAPASCTTGKVQKCPRSRWPGRTRPRRWGLGGLGRTPHGGPVGTKHLQHVAGGWSPALGSHGGIGQ